MKAVAHGDCREPDLPRPCHRELDRLPRRQLAKRIAGVDHHCTAAIADHLAGAPVRHGALVDALDVHGHQHHAVGGNPFNVCGNQVRRDHLRVRGRNPYRHENIGDG